MKSRDADIQFLFLLLLNILAFAGVCVSQGHVASAEESNSAWEQNNKDQYLHSSTEGKRKPHLQHIVRRARGDTSGHTQ